MSVVPKKKTSPSRRNMRRSHDSLKINMGTTCSNCNSTILCHTMCNNCGYYKGKLIKQPKLKKNN